MSCQNGGLVEGDNWKEPPTIDTALYVTLDTEQLIEGIKTFQTPPIITTAGVGEEFFGRYSDYLAQNETTYDDGNITGATTPSGVEVDKNLFTTDAGLNAIAQISVRGTCTATGFGDLMESYVVQLWGINSGLLGQYTAVLTTPQTSVFFSLYVCVPLLEINSGENIYVKITPTTTNDGAGPYEVQISGMFVQRSTKNIPIVA
jgi:hypothetical protein